MSSEAHEPCAIKGKGGKLERIEDYRPSMELWECRCCGAPFGVVLGHVPFGCPSCGLTFTVLLVDGEYKTRDEMGLRATFSAVRGNER